MLELKQILEEYGWTLERESGTAYFYNFAPWIAPNAYLHIVFKGANKHSLEVVGDEIQLPQGWRDTLATQNGAILYSGAISFFGVNFPTALMSRADVFEGPPFSIVDENRNWPSKEPDRYVSIGGYGYDGTRAVLDRRDGDVFAMPRKTDSVLRRWPDADTWVRQELDRLTKLFDRDGKITMPKEETVPHVVH
jgi:hypothetical protein